MFFPQIENNLIIITICKGWELRRRVDQCQSFQFYWNLNHPPPPSSCQEEVGFQKLQKPPKFLQKKRKIFSWPASWKNPNFINIPLPTDCYCHNPMIIRGEHICGGGEPRSDCTCRVWVLLLLLLPHCIIAHFLETTVRVGRKLQLPFNGSCQKFGLENNTLAPALFLNNQLMPWSIIRFDQEKQSEFN